MLASIVSGIISGLIASSIMFLLLLMIKPRIKVSDKMCVDPSDCRCRIKVVNQSKFNLLDVKYTLLYCSKRGDGIVDIFEIEPAKSPVESMNKFDKGNPDHPYALRISYDLKEHLPLRDKSYFEFTIRARHSFSNAVVFIKKKYGKEDLIKGHFETKSSMTILRAS